MATKQITPTLSPDSKLAASKEKHTLKFIGRFQPSTTRLPGKPPVDYKKGGDDFRCPKNAVTTSSFGRQVLSFKHTNTAAATRFPSGSRFLKADSVGVGPNAFGQMSSMGRQYLSNRRAHGAVTFGTSTREGALKTYAIFTCSK